MEKYTLLHTSVTSSDNKDHYLILDKPVAGGTYLIVGDDPSNESTRVFVEKCERMKSNDPTLGAEYITKIDISDLGVKEITFFKGASFVPVWSEFEMQETSPTEVIYSFHDN